MGSLIMQVLALKSRNETVWCDCHTKPFQGLFLLVVQWSYIYCKSANEILWSAVLIILPSTIFFFQTDKGMRFFFGERFVVKVANGESGLTDRVKS